MKVAEVAKKYGFSENAFEQWMKNSGVRINPGFFGNSIDDSLSVDDLATKFRQHLAAEEEQRKVEEDELMKEKEAIEKTAIEKNQAMASMLITSGFNFDGYTIAKYSGYISGDSAVSMDRPTHGWLGGVNKETGQDLLAGLSLIRRKALEELKEAAHALGCNAVIGVDFDYITLDPETATSSGGTLYLPFLFAVTANGNAVVIKKN